MARLAVDQSIPDAKPQLVCIVGPDLIPSSRRDPGLSTRVGRIEDLEMPKFKIAVTDDAGHMLYDEWIEAAGPMEACAKAVSDAGTADVAESEKDADPVGLLRSMAPDP